MVGRRKTGRRRKRRRIEKEEKQVVQGNLLYQGKQLFLESMFPPKVFDLTMFPQYIYLENGFSKKCIFLKIDPLKNCFIENRCSPLNQYFQQKSLFKHHKKFQTSQILSTERCLGGGG